MFIVLKPTDESFVEMTQPSTELSLATLVATSERDRVKGRVVDLADSLRRVGYLREELSAWQVFCRSYPTSTVECLRWPHFEYRYGKRASTEHRQELERARESILRAAARNETIVSRLAQVMRAP